MCIAIPGPFSSHGPKTPLGRFVRSHPASLGIGAAVVIILMALAGLLLPATETPYWSLSVLLQGIGALLLVGVLAHVPARCDGEGLGYPGHWLIAVGLLAGALVATLGGIVASLWAIGSGLIVMVLTLAAGARNLRWQLLWCHRKPGAALRLAPAATIGGAIASVGAGITTGPVAIAATVIAICAWLTLVLGLQGATRAPTFG